MSICWTQDTACGKACGLPSQVEAEEETEVEGTPSNTCDLCINGVTTAAKLITDTGCTQLSKKQIRSVCKQIGAEKTPAFQKNCNKAFPKYCPRLEKLITNGTFEAAQLCKNMGHCQ